ncbi:MAG TPA: hypothetical protein VET48_06495, partial [Steroidobacteraceae bacterium]|nr:hypothetical protein [Steroidobacteraceae bacterium]
MKTDAHADRHDVALISGAPNVWALMTRDRWVEVTRILVTGLVALLYWRQLIAIELLWIAVA